MRQPDILTDQMSAAGSAALRSLPIALIEPSRPAVISDNGELLTYGQLAHRAGRLAGALRARGLSAGDVVAVLCENRPAYLEMTWACRLAGLYWVPLNTHLGRSELAYIANDSGAVAVLRSAGVTTDCDFSVDDTPGIRVRVLLDGDATGWENYDTLIDAGPAHVADSDLEGDMLQYSSGTTGRPKGIKRPLRPAPATPAEDPLTFLIGLIGAGSESTYLCPAPLFHTAPNVWTMTMTRVGATVVLMRRFQPEEALALIQEHRVTHGQFVPTMFSRMVKLPASVRDRYDVSSLQGVVHAAAPCPIGIKQLMIDWWGPIISEYWSSSEGAGFTFISSPEWLEHRGSVGRSILGPLHICDSNGHEQPVGEPGVIWAEGVEFNYLNDPGKNADSTSREGWRSVGDIGRLDEDGYLYLTDRASFMIISGGVNIYPQEAENLLIEHPLVLDAAVVGVPDDDLGEIAVAIVQLLDMDGTADTVEAELARWCEEHLARYKCPRRYEFWESLPRTETGKLHKHRLRELLVGGSR